MDTMYAEAGGRGGGGGVLVEGVFSLAWTFSRRYTVYLH